MALKVKAVENVNDVKTSLIQSCAHRLPDRSDHHELHGLRADLLLRLISAACLRKPHKGKISSVWLNL